MINNKASVLIVSLWVLLVLSLLAVGLGYQASLDLKLSKNETQRFKAYLLARSGVIRTIALIDNKFLSFAGKTDKEIFSKDFEDGGGKFEIGYQDESNNFVHGIKPQDGRININILSWGPDFQMIVLKNLFFDSNVSDALELSLAITQWVDPQSVSILGKKDNFSVPEELIIALENFYIEKGLPIVDATIESKATYKKIKDIIRTEGDNKIDVSAVSPQVLRILVASAAENSGYDSNLVNSLYVKLNNLLNSQSFKKDGNMVISDATAEEASVLDYLKNNVFKSGSDIFKIESRAQFNNAKRKIEVVYNQKDKKIAYWQEN